MSGYIYYGDNNTLFDRMLDKGEYVDLVYLDPPFNTGKAQEIHGRSYLDTFASVAEYKNFLFHRLYMCYKLLSETGSLYLHLDYRMVHEAKLWLDSIFGRECFINEIIWAYDYGGRPKNRWPAKHDNILFYAKDPKRYHFSFEEVDRIPYMAPNLVGAEKAARGKTPTDVFWHTIVHTTGSERVDYPTQKPMGVIRRLINSSCPPGGLVLDPFAGSGTSGAVCLESGRRFILCDNNIQAIEVMKKRLPFAEVLVL